VWSLDTIRLEADGRGSFTFTFSSGAETMSGRVNVGTEGPPDRRSTSDKEQAAKNQIWRWHANSPRPVNSGRLTPIIAEMGGPIMTTGYHTSLAIKVGYYVLAAGVAVFVGMLLLTAYP
jgi:hypothetical protein